jgi:protein-tyrosine phosphatase
MGEPMEIAEPVAARQERPGAASTPGSLAVVDGTAKAIPLRFAATPMIDDDLPWTSRRLRIVFACTGNRFRSPIAAGYLRRLLAGVPVEIDSCGIGKAAAAGRPALPEALSVASSSAVRLGDHRSRWIRDVPLADADLVVGFEHSHVAAAVFEGGAAPERTFLFTEIVELLRFVDPVHAAEPRRRVRALVEAAHRQRRAEDRFPEVVDPLGRRRQDYEKTAVEIWSLTFELVQGLFASEPVPASALPRPQLRRSFRPRRLGRWTRMR